QPRPILFPYTTLFRSDPSDAPNYYNFDDEVLYAINIDNNRDGNAEDVVYEVRFKTENRPIGGPGGLTSPVPYLGNPHITALGGRSEEHTSELQSLAYL